MLIKTVGDTTDQKNLWHCFLRLSGWHDLPYFSGIRSRYYQRYSWSLQAS